MESWYDPQLIWLFLVAIPIGIAAILIGGTQFFSLPVFQLMFPGLTIGAIVGNMKVGSVLRNLVALQPLRSKLRARETIPIAIPLCIGAMIGAFGIARVSQVWLLPLLLLAITLTEYGPALAKRLPKGAFTVIALLVGLFGGILGAGISVLILGLLRMKIPEDDKILDVRVQGVFLEMVTQAASLVGFYVANQLILQIWVTWAAGAMIGGYIGGRLLKKTGKAKPATQKLLLRIVYTVALLVAAWRAFA